jgi:hypothetical protein
MNLCVIYKIHFIPHREYSVFASEGRIGKFCVGKEMLFIVRVAVSEVSLSYIYIYIYVCVCVCVCMCVCDALYI